MPPEFAMTLKNFSGVNTKPPVSAGDAVWTMPSSRNMRAVDNMEAGNRLYCHPQTTGPHKATQAPQAPQEIIFVVGSCREDAACGGAL